MTISSNTRPPVLKAGEHAINDMWDALYASTEREAQARVSEVEYNLGYTRKPEIIQSIAVAMVDEFRNDYHSEGSEKPSMSQRAFARGFWAVGEETPKKRREVSRLQVTKLNIAIQGLQGDREALDVFVSFASPDQQKAFEKVMNPKKSGVGTAVSVLGALLGITSIAANPTVAAAAQTTEVRTAPVEYENYPLNFTEQTGGVNMPENGEISIGLDANKLSDTRYKNQAKSIIQTLNNSPELVDMYKTIQKETGLDWRIIAAVHYREHGFSLQYPTNGQGLFQNTKGGYPKSGTATREQVIAEGVYMVGFLKGKLGDKLKNNDSRYLNPGDSEFNPDWLWRAAALYNGLPKFYQDQADRVVAMGAPGYLGSPYVVNKMYDQTDSKINKNFGQFPTDTSTKPVPAGDQLGFMPLVLSLFEASGTKLDGTYGGKPVYIMLPGDVRAPAAPQTETAKPAGIFTPTAIVDGRRYWSQEDERYDHEVKYNKFKNGKPVSSGDDVESSGCGVMSAINTAALDPNYAGPDIEADTLWFQKNGYRPAAGGTDFEGIAAYINSRSAVKAEVIKKFDVQAMMDGLKSGKAYIINIEGNAPIKTSGHIITVVGLNPNDPSRVKILDSLWPEHNAISYSLAELAAEKHMSTIIQATPPAATSAGEAPKVEVTPTPAPTTPIPSIPTAEAPKTDIPQDKNADGTAKTVEISPGDSSDATEQPGTVAGIVITNDQPKTGEEKVVQPPSLNVASIVASLTLQKPNPNQFIAATTASAPPAAPTSPNTMPSSGAIVFAPGALTSPQASGTTTAPVSASPETATNPTTSPSTQAPLTTTLDLSSPPPAAKATDAAKTATIDTSTITQPKDIAQVASGLKVADSRTDGEKAGVSPDQTSQKSYDDISKAIAEKNAAEQKAAAKADADAKTAADAARAAADTKAAAKAAQSKSPEAVTPSIDPSYKGPINSKGFGVPVPYDIYKNAGVTCGYNGYKNIPGVHTGVDFGVSYVAALAVKEGTIVRAVPSGKNQYIVTIKFANGDGVDYQHLSAINVRVGDKVKLGQKIGTTGASYDTNGNPSVHLHLDYTHVPDAKVPSKSDKNVFDETDPLFEYVLTPAEAAAVYQKQNG